MKINPNYYPVLFFGTLALGILLGATLNFPQQGNLSASDNHRNKLNKLIDFIDNEYVLILLSLVFSNLKCILSIILKT